MNNKFFKLKFSCDKNFELMKGNGIHRHCDSCSKTVYDFTKLNREEILNKLESSNKTICAKFYDEQMEYDSNDKSIKSARSKEMDIRSVAAGLAVAISLSAISPALSQNLNQTYSNTDIIAVDQILNQNTENVIVKGQTLDHENKILPNVRITFYSLVGFYTTESDSKGYFQFEIPEKYLTSENYVLGFYYRHLENIKKRPYVNYQSQQIVLNISNLSKEITQVARNGHSMGAVVLVTDENGDEIMPYVLLNGKEIDYKEYEKIEEGIHESISLDNMNEAYFKYGAADALLGRNVDAIGLIILVDKIKR